MTCAGRCLPVLLTSIHLTAQPQTRVLLRAGGSNNDEPTCAAATPEGIAIGGVTESADGTFTAMNHGGQDGFLIMVTPWGEPLWTLTAGGSSVQDWLHAVAYTPRRKGLLIAVGSTFSEDGTFAIRKRWGRDEGFVMMVSTSTGKVKKVRLLGGSLSDVITDVAVLPSGYMLICGYTSSKDGIFERGRIHGTSSDNYDLWVSLLKKSGKPLWTTLITGKGDDLALALTTDGTYVYVGGTSSSEEQTWHAAGTGYDALVAALTLSRGEVLWVRTVGGHGQDEFRDIALAEGQLVAVGSTTSEGLPGAQGAVDIYLAGMDAASGRVIWQRAVGSEGVDWATSVICPAGEGVCVAAAVTTASSSRWQVSTATDEMLLVTFSASDGKPTHFTTTGGSFADRPAALISHRSGLYVVGSTSSEDWAVAGAVPVGGQDIVLVKVAEALPAGGRVQLPSEFSVCVGCGVKSDSLLRAYVWEQAYSAGDTLLIKYEVSGGFLSQVDNLPLAGFALREVVLAMDSLILAVGNTFSAGAAAADAVVGLWTPQGRRLVGKTVGGPRRDEFSYAFVLDSVAVVAGTLFSGNSFTSGYRGSADLWLTVWRLPALHLFRSVAFGTLNNDVLMGACVRSPRAIALVGATAQVTGDGILVITDTAGATLALTTLSGESYDALTHCQWEGTVLWLGGVTASPDIVGRKTEGVDALLLRYTEGRLQPVYHSLMAGDAVQTLISLMPDSRLALAYVNRRVNVRTGSYSSELIVEMIDRHSGKRLWQKTIVGNATHIHLHRLQVLPDNSILICGWQEGEEGARQSLMEVVTPQME